MEIPAGERLVWLSRTSNPWLHLTAALTGLVAAAAVVAGAGGLIGWQWALIAPFAVASVLVLCCSSVQARVTGAGLEVSFGPLGWPVRRWTVRDIVLSRAERRTPAQVRGWGYRLSGLGTTVMLRAGECLVIHPRNGTEFAVSVDGAERGAALLNSLSEPQLLSVQRGTRRAYRCRSLGEEPAARGREGEACGARGCCGRRTGLRSTGEN